MSVVPLTPARRAEIEGVFEHALDLSPDRREEWLRQRCAHDPALRAEVDALLSAHDGPPGILDKSIVDVAPALTVEPLRDRRIGPYRVVRELGRGGMGVVYLAERVDGEYRREVAIKLLRNSPDAEELHRRFIAERQILASLSHPHIAQLLDGGTTDGQLPYLVMEYVDGMPITTYCDREGLGVAARLRLFVDVCRAVHAAHQNLVIHRDIKPGNILVTASGQVKLLDFGIAKLLNAGMGGVETPHTRTAFRVMTPDYASPEQVRGESLTTSSDVYALGVVLYELLAGRRPYQIRTGSVRELHELVCEREPERPSTGARHAADPDDPDARTPLAIAVSRGTSPDRLHRQLTGDLDAIVMMALRKEPRRRYGSAELLAEDIERHLSGMPVVARHASKAYYVGKFLRRHRAATALGALAVLSLVAGTAVALDQTTAARRERDRASGALKRAEQALRESEETTTFLAGLFNVDAPIPPGAAMRTTDSLIARGVAQIELLRAQPLVQARMLDGMGRVYVNLGRFADATAAYERSLALRRANGQENSPEAATTLLHLADALRLLGRYVIAESVARQALLIRQRMYGATDPSVADGWDMLSMLAVYRSQLANSEAYARKSLAIRTAAYGSDDLRTARSLEILAGAVRRLGRTEEGERYFRSAIALYERGYGANDPYLVVPLGRLADAVAVDKGDYDDAVRLMERAVSIASTMLGKEHPRTAFALGSLGEFESHRGNAARAEQLERRAIDILEHSLGHRDFALADAYSDLSRAYARAGRWNDAERAVRQAMAIYDTVVTSSHSAYAGAVFGLAEIHYYTGRLGEAQAEVERAYEIRRRALGDSSFALTGPLMLLGDLRARRGELAAADTLYARALRLLTGRVPETHKLYPTVYARLAALRELQRRPAEAADFRRKANGNPVRPLNF